MASRNGKAKLTPAPFSTVLREICFFVMNMVSRSLTKPRKWPLKGTKDTEGFCEFCAFLWPDSYALLRLICSFCRHGCRLRTLLSKRLCIHYSQHYRRKLVIVFRGPTNNRAHLRHIEILQLTVEGVHHQPFCQRLREHCGMAGQL